MIFKCLLILIILSITNSSFAQTISSSNKITDSIHVVELAKKEKLFLYNNAASPPVVSFNKYKNKWKLVSTETNNVTGGDCKNSNGCIANHYIVLIIDAETGTIKSKQEKTTLQAILE